ncbi:hypothetical protein V498_09028, partial [Pseudogymnoascus sp. VKM F-4517 (FW-2822)]
MRRHYPDGMLAEKRPGEQRSPKTPASQAHLQTRLAQSALTPFSGSTVRPKASPLTQTLPPFRFLRPNRRSDLAPFLRRVPQRDGRQRRPPAAHLHPRDAAALSNQLLHAPSSALLPHPHQAPRAQLRLHNGAAGRGPRDAGPAVRAPHVPVGPHPGLQVPAGPQLLGARVEQDLRPQHARDQPERDGLPGRRQLAPAHHRRRLPALDRRRASVHAEPISSDYCCCCGGRACGRACCGAAAGLARVDPEARCRSGECGGGGEGGGCGDGGGGGEEGARL